MTAHPRILTADRFEADRPRLRAVAHRLLGSLGEADDAVQVVDPERLAATEVAVPGARPARRG
ncbi:hypothetical protein ABZ137_29610 [Streptomyces bobili]